MRETTEPLRVRTYLAPSLPEALFEGVAEYLGRVLGRPAILTCDASKSGPRRGESLGDADLAFVCGTSLVWLQELPDSAAVLVGAAPVFAHPGVDGRPVYFAEVVVRAADPARGLSELKGRRLAFNDDVSLSGYYGVLAELERRGLDTRFFGALVRSGSHLRSLAMIEAGEVDAASVDSNVLTRWQSAGPARPEAILRTVHRWGPLPVQPLVASCRLAPAVRSRIERALLEAHCDERLGPILGAASVSCFAPIRMDAYEPVRAIVRAADRLQPAA